MALARPQRAYLLCERSNFSTCPIRRGDGEKLAVAAARDHEFYVDDLAEDRAFVIDDDPDIRMLLSIQLKSFGWTVDTHDSGFGLAVALRRCQPKLIFVDIHMPGLSGNSALGTALSMCEFEHRPKIFVVSAGTPEEIERAMVMLGADGCFRKPITCEQLESCVRLAREEPWSREAV